MSKKKRNQNKNSNKKKSNKSKSKITSNKRPTGGKKDKDKTKGKKSVKSTSTSSKGKTKKVVKEFFDNKRWKTTTDATGKKIKGRKRSKKLSRQTEGNRYQTIIKTLSDYYKKAGLRLLSLFYRKLTKKFNTAEKRLDYKKYSIYNKYYAEIRYDLITQVKNKQIELNKLNKKLRRYSNIKNYM